LLLKVIDSFPHFYPPMQTYKYRDSEALNAVRIYAAVKAVQGMKKTEAGRDNVSYPTEEVLLQRINSSWSDPTNALQLLSLLYYEVPARNDYVLKVYFDEDQLPADTDALNYVIVPKRGPIHMKLNAFKTQNNREAYITSFDLSESLSEKLRRYIAKEKKTKGDYMFENSDAKMGRMLSRAIEAIGYGYMSENFFRRWKASWTHYQVERGALSEEDEITLSLKMMHSWQAHLGYIYPINDGQERLSAASRRERECEKIKPCIEEVVRDVLGEEGKEEKETEPEPAPKRARR
jgi:hypothetical protein